MPTVSLNTTSMLGGQPNLAAPVVTAFLALQTAINGLDQNNFAAGKLFDLAKLMTGGAAAGDLLRHNGTDWVKFTWPLARVSRTATQSVTTATDTAIAWENELEDTAGIVDIAAHDTRLTLPLTGTYAVTVGGAFSQNTSGYRVCGYKLNGGTFSWVETRDPTTGTNTVVNIGFLVAATADDYLEFWVRQTSGSTLTFENARATVHYLTP